VFLARERQQVRYRDEGIRTNSEMLPSHIKKYCALDPEGEIILAGAVKRFHLSGRAFDRLLKLTRTIADLAGQETLAPQHLAEALQYRGFEKLALSKPQSVGAETI
jgi:magnesium chelatase family protein